MLEPGVVVTVEGTRRDGNRTLLRGRVVAAGEHEAALALEPGLSRLATGRGDVVALRWYRLEGPEGVSARVVELAPFTGGLVVTAPGRDGPDRRHGDRLRRDLPVHWWGQGREGDGRLLDVGPGGLRFLAAAAPGTGGTVTLAVAIDGQPFDITGLVVGDEGDVRRVRFELLGEGAARALAEALDGGVRGALRPPSPGA